MDFDLADITAGIIAGSPTWTLDDLVDAVDAATPPNKLRAAYREALRDYVRHQLARPDQVTPGDHGPRVGAGATSSAIPGQKQNDDQATLAGGGGVNLDRSRAALFRAAGFRVRVHAAPGLWKPLLECTVDELLYAAAENDVLAEANARAADRYRLLAKLMQERGVGTPAELPAELLAGAFDDER